MLVEELSLEAIQFCSGKVHSELLDPHIAPADLRPSPGKLRFAHRAPFSSLIDFLGNLIPKSFEVGQKCYPGAIASSSPNCQFRSSRPLENIDKQIQTKGI
jgi:hypothetical protein